MDIHSIGKQVRQMRLALGISQVTLARLAGLTRVTIGNLEAGKLRDLGFQKVLRICELLGLNLSTSTPAGTHDWLRIAAQTASTSYGTVMTAAELQAILITGIVPDRLAAHMATLLQEAPPSVVLGAARTAAECTPAGGTPLMPAIMKNITAMAQRWHIDRFA